VVSKWGVTPRASVEAECERRGIAEVVADCVAILDGRRPADQFAFVLAGPASRTVMAGAEGGPDGHWPRVWALRGLLYAWRPGAARAVIKSLGDPSWRVREMAAKVVARHRIGRALTQVARLGDDPVPRVRRASQRALEALVGGRA
jgi:HEAT repeat protein